MDERLERKPRAVLEVCYGVLRKVGNAEAGDSNSGSSWEMQADSRCDACTVITLHRSGYFLTRKAFFPSVNNRRCAQCEEMYSMPRILGSCMFEGAMPRNHVLPSGNSRAIEDAAEKL